MNYYEFDSDDGGFGHTDLSPPSRLLQAVQDKDLNAIRSLLENGTNIHVRDHRGRDALQVAASIRDIDEIVLLLLDKGVNPNSSGSVDGNALTAAARTNNISTLRILLEHGAITDPRSGFGMGGCQNTQHKAGALQQAADVGKTEAVQLLLQHGADANPVVAAGMHGFPLQAAVQYGNEDIVWMLLDAGANVNAVGGYHGTALQAAARYGRERLVKLLLDHGADVNAQGGVYKTALESAIRRGHISVAKLLQQRGAKE